MLKSPKRLDMRLHEGYISLNKQETRSSFESHECQIRLPWKHQALRIITCHLERSKPTKYRPHPHPTPTPPDPHGLSWGLLRLFKSFFQMPF